MFRDALYHPRRLRLRRAIFQVHLWLGVLLTVYVALIGLSGSILVFEDELRAHANRDLYFDPAHQAAPQQVLAAAARTFPGESPTFLSFPSKQLPAYTLYLRDAHNMRRTVLADATDGHLMTARPKLLLDLVHEFHVYLLMGETGFTINCVAGIGLLVLALTGAALWWPGLRLWTRGFRINVRARWRRINYDSHNLIGILTLAIVAWWGLTSVYFLWPKQTARVVAAVSPLQGMREPVAPAPPPQASRTAGTAAVIARVLAEVQTRNPHGYLSGIALPADPSGNIVAYVDTHAPGDYSHRDIHTFRGSTGSLLTTWHYGDNHTAGDWLLWLVYPLHFGTLWGRSVKVVWFLLGLSLPALAFTGLVMYWNRYLRHRLAALTHSN